MKNERNMTFCYFSRRKLKWENWKFFLFNFTGISCSHNRCPYYFTESIRSKTGFYGRKCRNLFSIVFGLCQRENNIGEEFLVGEDCDVTARGVFTVKTNSVSPFARGKGHIKHRTVRWASHLSFLCMQAFSRKLKY